MVYFKRILFLSVVVISFLCNGLVDSKSGSKNDVEIEEDIDSYNGVVIELRKERDKRQAVDIQKECLDCQEGYQDSQNNNIRFKRSTNSKVRKKNKKRLKEPADSPVTKSKSFSNYFSSFWGEKESSTDNKTSDETKRKNKSKKLKKAKNQKKTQVKQTSSNNLDSKGKSLVNYYSNYWKDGQDGATKDENSDSKTSQNVDKKETLDAKKNLPEEKEHDSNSLLNHFSEFWTDGGKSGTPNTGNAESVGKNKQKTNVSKKKVKKEKKDRKNKKHSKPKTKVTSVKTNKKSKSDIEKSRKDGDKEETKPNKDDEKLQKKETSKSVDAMRTKGSGSDVLETDVRANVDNTDKQEKNVKKIKIRKTKANKKRLKKKRKKKKDRADLKKSQDKNKNLNATPIESVNRAETQDENDKAPAVEEKSDIKTDSNAEGVNTILKEDKKYKKTKAGKKESNRKISTKGKSEKESEIMVDIEEPVENNMRKPDVPKNVKGNPKSSDVDSKERENGKDSKMELKPSHPNEARKLETEHQETETEIKESHDRNTFSRVDQNRKHTTDFKDSEHIPNPTKANGNKAKPIKPATYSESVLKPTKAYENEPEHAKPSTYSENVPKPTKPSTTYENESKLTKPSVHSENVPKPTKSIPIKRRPKKKLKTSSKKLSYYELLAKAEKDFRRRDEKIRRRLSALSTKTGKRYQKFKSLSDKRFNEVNPTATFNFSHPKQQSRASQVSMSTLKKMIINLNNYSLHEYNDEVSNSTPNVMYPALFKKNMQELPQGDEPRFDINSLIEMSKQSRQWKPIVNNEADSNKKKTYSNYDINSLIDQSRKTRKKDLSKSVEHGNKIKNKNPLDPNKEKSSKNVSGSFSFLNYYSTFWKTSGTDSLISPKRHQKARKTKNLGRKKRKRKGKRNRMRKQKGVDDKRPVDHRRKNTNKMDGMQNDSPNLSPVRRKQRIEKLKRRKTKQKQLRRKKKQDSLIKTDKENARNVKTSNADKTAVTELNRLSMNRLRKLRKKGRKGKGKNGRKHLFRKDKSSHLRPSGNFRSLDPPVSYRDESFSRHIKKRQRQTKKQAKRSNRNKGSRGKRVKSRRKNLKPLISKRSRKHRKRGKVVAKKAKEPQADFYVNDQGVKEGSGNYDRGYYDNDKVPTGTRRYRNKSARSKPKRGRKSRRNRMSKRKRNNRKQLREGRKFQLKHPRNDDGDVEQRDDRFRGYADRRVFNDDDGYYYHAVRGSNSRFANDRGENGGYFYRERGRDSRRYFDGDRYDDYDRDRVVRGRHYNDGYDDRGRRVYRLKEVRIDDRDYPRRNKESKRPSNDQYNDDDILYYIYPVRRGDARRRYDDNDGRDPRQDGRDPRQDPGYDRRGDSSPRRDDRYDDDYYPRRPVSRWRGRDEYTRGYTRYAPRQGSRYDTDPWRHDGYGSSIRGEQEIRGRDGRRLSGKHDDYDRGRGDIIDSRGNQNIELDNGRRISSRLHPEEELHNPENARRPGSRRGDNYYAELERRRQQERIRMKERQRELQLQRVAPRVNQKIQSLKQHVQGVLRHYTQALAQSEQVYKEVFNDTRYKVMSGMGEVYEGLNDANDDIYDAVISASNTARSIFMKAHKRRAAQAKGLTGDEPAMEPKTIREAELKVRDRDFRQTFLRAQMEKRQLETDGRHFKMLKMKHSQGIARFQQVKEHFKDRYDHEILLNIFSNMRATIENVNEELACSHNLRPLQRDKLYLDHAKKEMDVAKKAIFESREAVQNGQTKLMEIDGLYRKYETEKNRNARRLHRSQNRRNGKRVKRDIDPREFQKLKQMTSQCRRHSMELNHTAVLIRRTLERPILLGKAAIQRRGKKVPMSQLTPVLVRLRSNFKDMFMTLDDLRVYVDSQPKIVLTKKCSETLIEGSGSGDTDDEDYECVEEDEEDADFSSNGPDEGDFTFDENEKGKPESSVNSNPILSFGDRLSEYTSQLLSKSENLHEIAHHVLTKATKGLKNRLQISKLGKDLSMKKDVQSNLVLLKSNREEVKSRLEKISEKLDRVNEVDFDGIKAQAIEALKRTKEKTTTKSTILVETTTKSTILVETTKPTEVVKPTKGLENGTTESSTWDLFRKGKDIESNRDDIKNLQSLALNVYTKSCGKMNKIQDNISVLMKKVEKARNMLSSLQLSMSKTSDSPIPVSVPPPSQDVISKSLVTTMSICIKPKSMDGTVFYVQGNQSASYALTLDGGELTATVYDDDNDELESVTLGDELTQDSWYTVEIMRSGHSLSLSAKGQDGEIQRESTEVGDISVLQRSSFIKSFIGGIPDDEEIGGEPWQGCVGELVLDGQSLSPFQASIDGQQPALCTDHCVSQGRNLTWSFDGDGFVHYSLSPEENIESLSISFQTTQSTASILTAVIARWRFHLYISLENGAVKLETPYGILQSNSDSLNDGTLHRLKILYKSRRINPELDGDESAFSTLKERPTLHREIKDGVLLGSVISKDRKYLEDRALIGCVGRLVINGNPMLYTDATEVYHAHYGPCEMRSVWKSCAGFTSNSVPVSLGSVENSNLVTLLVHVNATGPLMLYEKEDNFKVLIKMTDDHIEVYNQDSEAILLKKEDEDTLYDNVFTLVTLEDQGKKVTVSAFAQSTTISYLSWFSIADTSAPHTISLGAFRKDDDDDDDDDDSQSFIGSLSQLVIEDRLYDFKQFYNSSKLESCRRPLPELIPNQKVVPNTIDVCS